MPYQWLRRAEAPLYLKLMTRRACLEDVPKHIDVESKKQLLRRVSMFRYAEYGVLGTSAQGTPLARQEDGRTHSFLFDIRNYNVE